MKDSRCRRCGERYTPGTYREHTRALAHARVVAAEGRERRRNARGAQRSHGEGHSPESRYLRAMGVLADRRRLLRVACAKDLSADLIDRAAQGVADAIREANALRPSTEVGYPDRDGDWNRKEGRHV